jgi:uncharacterized tellurite resistance protein B-like protein
MRSYPANSPHAAARILALALLADGHLSQSELGELDRLRAGEQLGLTRGELLQVLHTLCEDLLAGGLSQGAGWSQLDERTLAQLLAEVDDPALRLRVLQLCVQLVQADDHVAEGEEWVLWSAVEQWGLQPLMLQGGGASAPVSARA